MGVVKNVLDHMRPEELNTLSYLGCNFIQDYPKFLPLVEEIIHLAIQGQLKIMDSSYKTTADGVPYITHLEYKKIT